MFLRNHAVTYRSSRPECSVKKVFLEISSSVSFSIKLQVSVTLLKEALAQVFSCEFSEISIKTFVYRTTLVTAYVRMVTLMCVKELIAQWLGPCFTNLEWPVPKLIGGSMIESALFHPRYMKWVQGIPWGLVVKIKLQGEPCPWKRALSFILLT